MATPTKYTLRQHGQFILRALGIYKAFPKPVMISAALSSLAEAALPFVNLFFSARMLNELAGARHSRRLATLVLLTVGINLLATLAQKALSRWQAYCGSNMWRDFYRVYTEKSLSLDYADQENPATQQAYMGILQNQMGMGFGLPRLAQSVPEIVKGLVQIALSVALTVGLITLGVPPGSPYGWLDSGWMLGGFVLVLMGTALLAPYLSTVGGKIWARATGDNNKSNRFFSYYFFDMIRKNDSAKDIRMYRQRDIIKKQVTTPSGAFDLSSWQEAARYNGRFDACAMAVTCLCNGLVYLYVALKALAGAFGVGGIVLYVGAITQLGRGCASVLSCWGALLNNNPFLEQAFRFLDMPNPMYQGSLTTEKRSDKKYEIEFRNVSFKYPAAEDYALRNVSMKLRIGRRMAIVGQNGSGKTTFIKLLCRLYDPDEGEILLNGVDIRKYSYPQYIAIFSVVFQDFQLLPFTLGQNVAADMRYDSARVRGALEQAGFGGRLDTLPHGLDTYLYKRFDEEGVEVSGGEAQKIALARALYKDAPFIILDEPTAALDPVAEFEVYSRMNEIVGDKTAVFISHRLSSCRFCADIAVFHQGCLVQQGSHDTLIAAEGGKYHELWYAQAQYYAPE